MEEGGSQLPAAAPHAMPARQSSDEGAAAPSSAQWAVIASSVVSLCTIGAVVWLAMDGVGHHSAAPALVAPPAAKPVVAPGDPAASNAEIGRRMAAVLGRFAAWAAAHRGAPCPDLAELGTETELSDPWGHRFALTCTGQPEDQIIGLISAGPDGTAGTADDVASWQLGRELTDRIRGPRWIAVTRIADPHR